MASIVRDITEQLRVEKARKQSEAMCESLVSTAPDLILILDVDGTIRFINRVSPETSVEEIIGRSAYEFVREDFHDTMRACLEKVWETGEFVTCELVGQGADGSERWYESRHGALRQDGKMMGITVISSDITERKIEEQRLLAEDRMLRDLLEQRERERKLIAHEVHDGFMQDIIGAQLTLQSLLHAARVRQLPYLVQLEHVDESLRKAVNEGRRLIRELGPLVVDHVGLLAAIREHVEQEVVDGCLQVDVQENLDDTLYAPLLKGTVFRIVQEALNNVRHHSHAAHVKIVMREEDQRLHVEVKDDGVGFDPEHIASDRFGILGIRQRARLFGGHAVIDSSLGRGTTVRVNLPLILDRPLSDVDENE
jgi:PAS domain S-box-containing protein